MLRNYQYIRIASRWDSKGRCSRRYLDWMRTSAARSESRLSSKPVRKWKNLISSNLIAFRLWIGVQVFWVNWVLIVECRVKSFFILGIFHEKFEINVGICASHFILLLFVAKRIWLEIFILFYVSRAKSLKVRRLSTASWMRNLICLPRTEFDLNDCGNVAEIIWNYLNLN